MGLICTPFPCLTHNLDVRCRSLGQMLGLQHSFTSHSQISHLRNAVSGSSCRPASFVYCTTASMRLQTSFMIAANSQTGLRDGWQTEYQTKGESETKIPHSMPEKNTPCYASA